ncbi:serine hydrolase [Enemella sp. A6]|uniref:serine hydrolase n=1 Tax=Enemella sp. A6 TaxID=3440152 RepID=UPI003EBD21E6
MAVRKLLALLMIVPLLALVACSGGSGEPEGSESPATGDTPAAGESPGTDETPDESPAPSPASIPDTPVGKAGKWVIETLEADSGPTADEVKKRFAPSFLQQMPADQVPGVFDQLRGLRPFTVTQWNGTDTQAVARLSSDQGQFEMQITVDGNNLIDAMLFIPAEEVPEVNSPEEAKKALEKRAPNNSFLLADKECKPIEANNQDSALPMGSMFKLYVLGAVISEVEKGKIGWDDQLTVTDEVKSLPSGKLQDEPAGTKVTVSEAAELMISVSDNTATDMLINHVGREAVEAELTAMGHHQPEMLKPFTTTREIFQMAADPELRKRWAETTGSPTDPHAETSDKQREILKGLPAWDRQYNPEAMSKPFWEDSLEWYGTATDLCRAHQKLQERAKTPAGEPVRDILSKNPGVQLDDADYVGFKGGSTPGSIGLSYWVERGDEVKVLMMQTTSDNPETTPAESWIAGLAQQVLALG